MQNSQTQLVRANKLLWKSATEVPSKNLERILGHLLESKAVPKESPMINLSSIPKDQEQDLGSSYLLLEVHDSGGLARELEILRKDPLSHFKILALCETARDDIFSILSDFPEVHGILSPTNTLVERRIKRILGWERNADEAGEKTLWEIGIRQKRQGNDLKPMIQESLSKAVLYEGYAEDMITVLAELLSNAFFNAPFDQDTRTFPFKRSPRDVNVTLGDQKQVKVWLTEGPQFYSLTVHDPFGSLERRVLLENLERAAKRQHDQLRKEGPGSGVGLYTIFELATEISVTIHTGVSTLFECSFYKASRKRNYMEMGKNLVIERHEGG